MWNYVVKGRKLIPEQKVNTQMYWSLAKCITPHSGSWCTSTPSFTFMY